LVCDKRLRNGDGLLLRLLRAWLLCLLGVKFLELHRWSVAQRGVQPLLVVHDIQKVTEVSPRFFHRTILVDI
jgi:hypothetical protein